MFSRRNFLRRAAACGVAGLIGLSAIHDAAEAARFRVVARGRGAGGGGGGGMPSVGPGAAWNGTESSGFSGSEPSETANRASGSTGDAARPRPVVKWYTPTFHRFTGDMVVGFMADAFGGIASADINVEGNVHTGVPLSFYTYTDVNGVSRSKLGYWVTLPYASFSAHAPGTVRVYAKATANDAGMDARTIGPLRLFPAVFNSATVSGVAATFYVRTDGANVTDAKGTHASYTTIALAMHAVHTAAPESYELIFDQTGSYELGGLATVDNYTSHVGRAIWRATSGVTATLIRGTVFDDQNSASGLGEHAWEWWPSSGAIEFRGAGIVFDTKFFYKINQQTNDRHWLNGCKLLNSATGGRDALYWNKAPHPPFEIHNFNNDVQGAYFTDGQSIDVDVGGGECGFMFSGWSAKRQIAAAYRSDFVSYHYETESDPGFFVNGPNAMTITYSGAGAGTAVFTTNPSTLDLQVSGVSVGGGFPITLPDKPGTNFNVSDVVATINAHGAGWSASLLDDTRAAWILCGDGKTVSVTSGGTTFAANIGFHVEFIHPRSAGDVYENSLYLNVVCRKCNWTTGPLNFEGSSSNVPARDLVMRNVVLDQAGISGGGTSCTIGGVHVVVTGCSFEGGFTFFPDSGAIQYDAFCQIEENVFGGAAIYLGGAVIGSNSGKVKNNAAVGGWPGAADASNISITSLSSVVTDKANGNFAPAGTLLSNLKAPLWPYDGMDGSRANPDAIGPRRVGASAPSYPF